MGLATPIAFWGALGALVRRGWRVKSADFIQRLSQVDTVVFDKTGTLSEESLRLKDFVVAANFEREQLLAWIMKIQSLSHHPIARAFQLIPSATSFPCLITSVTSLPAVGLQAFVEIPLTESWVGGRRLLIEMGNHSLLQPRDLPRAEILRKLLKSSQCTHEVWIKVDGQLTGLAQLAETLRASAREAMDQLDRMGIAVQVMTGDTQLSAERLGIPNAQASLTPADKADRVRRLQSQGRRVLFIGDGLNDAAALAEAHASLSPAHASDLAIASSQAVIHHLYWGSVPEVLQMARQTVRGIRFNLCFAAAYNLIGIALAASGLLHPVAAALLMLAASATVTTRALTFAENIQLPPQQRPRPITWRQLLHQRARSLSPVAYLIVLGLMLQAILLIHLTAPSVLGETLIMVLAVLPSLVILNYWKSIDRSPLLQMVASMLSLGNLGMLVGWWADLHFGEMLMQGQVRSCCLQMPSGVLGLWPLSGMQIGMLVASFPLMVMINDPQSILFHSKTGQWLHALVGSLGMLLGMSGATQIFRGVPVLEAHTYFSLFYAAMTVGMLLGMFASCAFWRLCTSFLQPSREEKRIIKATEPYAKLL